MRHCAQATCAQLTRRRHCRSLWLLDTNSRLQKLESPAGGLWAQSIDAMHPHRPGSQKGTAGGRGVALYRTVVMYLLLYRDVAPMATPSLTPCTFRPEVVLGLPHDIRALLATPEGRWPASWLERDHQGSQFVLRGKLAEQRAGARRCPSGDTHG